MSKEYQEHTPKGRTVTVRKQKRGKSARLLVYYQSTLVAEFPLGEDMLDLALNAADETIDSWYPKRPSNINERW